MQSRFLTKNTDEGLGVDGGAMAQIPTYVTTVPDGTEKASRSIRTVLANLVANNAHRVSILHLTLEELTFASAL